MDQLVLRVSVVHQVHVVHWERVEREVNQDEKGQEVNLAQQVHLVNRENLETQVFQDE